MEIDLPAMMCNKRRSAQVYTSFSESLSPTQVQVSGFKLQIPKTQAKIQLASSKLRTSNSELRTPNSEAQLLFLSSQLFQHREIFKRGHISGDRSARCQLAEQTPHDLA
jgi:hypothetical protein